MERKTNMVKDGTGAYVFTHSGTAHADEVVAIALLIAAGFNVKEIERVNKINPEEVEDEDFIVDIGGVFSVEHKQFDHHQKDIRVEGKCAAELVAETYHPDLMGDPEFLHFIKLLSSMDNNGPVKTQETYSVSYETFNSLMLILRGLVKQFETNPLFVAEIVSQIIKEKKDFLKEVEEAKKWLKNNSEVETINGFNILVLHDKYSGTMSAGNRAQEGVIDEKNIHLVYNFDPRDPEGRCLFRTTNGQKVGIDLNTAKASTPTFCHKGGFLLNFKPNNDDEWRDIVDSITL